MKNVVFLYFGNIVLPIFMLIFSFFYFRKVEKTVATRILKYVINLFLVIFFFYNFPKNNLFVRIEEYKSFNNLSNRNVELVSLSKKLGNNINISVEISDSVQNLILGILKSNKPVSIVEGNLRGNTYWSMQIEEKSGRIYKFNIINSRRDLFISLYKDFEVIASFRNNKLKTVLANLSTPATGTPPLARDCISCLSISRHSPSETTTPIATERTTNKNEHYRTHPKTTTEKQ